MLCVNLFSDKIEMYIQLIFELAPSSYVEQWWLLPQYLNFSVNIVCEHQPGFYSIVT